MLPAVRAADQRISESNLAGECSRRCVRGCGLPLVQTCPHPNACLSCDNFLTDSSFRAIHQQQLEHTGQLRERAQEQGSLRLIEVLERDERSLTQILQGLDAIDADQHELDAPQPMDMVALAAARDRDRRSES